MSALWTQETGGHNELHAPPRRRNTASQTPIPTHPPKSTSTSHPPLPTRTNPPPSNSSTLPLTDPSTTTSSQKPTEPSTKSGATEGDDEALLFPLSLLPSASALEKVLPKGYTLLPLRPSDYKAGHVDTLANLTTVGDVSEQAWRGRWEWMKRRNGLDAGEGDVVGEYFVIAIRDEEGRVVGTGALIVERKFIHNLGLVGHIEDIVVRKDQQGKKLGLRIIETLDHVARQVGCYKAILDCSDANEGFYVKCGYERKGLEMAHYYDK